MTGKKILIVDADAASRNFIGRNLQEQKYETLLTGSGREGLIFAWRDRPDLIIADPVLPDLNGEEMAGRLRQDPRSANIPLIALSSDPNHGRSRACLEAGFKDYIPKSAQALPALMTTVNRLIGINSMSAREGGLLIVFLSAKGGTGVSSLCVNFATTFAQNQPEASVVVADLILPIGSIAQTVGYQGEENLVEVAEMQPQDTNAEYFEGHLQKLKHWNFHLLAGSPDPESSIQLKGERIGDVITALKDAFDYVLVDLGRSLSRITMPVIQNADLAVLVVSPDLSTATLTKIMWDYLKSKGLPSNSIYPILNRAVGLEGLTKPEVEKILGLEIKTAMPYLGSNFTLANNQHQPFSLKFPNDTAVFVFKETAQDMAATARRLRASEKIERTS